jgi:hypothetical protein
LHPTKGLKNVLKGYRFVSWLYPLWRGLFPKFVTTLEQLGLAMINIAIKGYPKNVIEVEDIKILAKE